MRGLNILSEEVNADEMPQLGYALWIKDIKIKNCICDSEEEREFMGCEVGKKIMRKIEYTADLVLKAKMPLDKAMIFSGLDKLYEPKVKRLL